MDHGVRVLFLVQPGDVSRAIMQDMIRGARRAGHEALTLDLSPAFTARAQAADDGAARAEASRLTAQVESVVRARRVQLVIAMWANGLTGLVHDAGGPAASPPAAAARAIAGRPVTCYERWGVGHLMYWLDAPQWAAQGSLMGLINSGLLAAPAPALLSVVNNPGIAGEMRRVLGFAHAADLPYAIDPDVFAPASGAAAPPGPPPSERGLDVAFASGPGDAPPTPEQLAALEDDAPDMASLRAAAAERVRGELARTLGEPVLADALLETQLAGPHTGVLDRLDALAATRPGLRAAIEGVLADAPRFVAATALVRRVDAWRRGFMVGYLARRCAVLLFGRGEYAGWLGPAAARTRVLPGHVPHQGQAGCYAQARLGLSVMRWQDDVGVHLKPFEIAASGTGVLAMRRAGLERVFAADEAAVFDEPAGALALVERGRRDGAWLDELARAGRARVLRDHTWATRMGQMIALAGGGPARAEAAAAVGGAGPVAAAITTVVPGVPGVPGVVPRVGAGPGLGST